MTLFKNKYRIESNRLKNWDYSSNGRYFITICTYNKIQYFGNVVDSKMEYSEIGKIAYNKWLKIPKRFKNATLDVFQTMPNHIHGIIIINNDNVETRQRDIIPKSLINNEIICSNESLSNKNGVSLREKFHGGVSLREKPNTRKFSQPIPGSISVMIGLFKSDVTKWCNNHNYTNFDWQNNFHDHIIRNERELQRIRNYIINNPINWEYDRNKRDGLWI